MDLRPSNFVIYEGICRIIDWSTLSNNESFIFTQGKDDPFWPRDSTIYIQRHAEWDIFHLALSMVYLGSNDEEKKQFFYGPEMRDELIATIASESETSFNGLQIAGAKMALKVQSCVRSQAVMDYDEMMF
jgi:hypothetical protein